VKFIVDAQLPKSLSDYINQKGHDSIHTLELPDQNRTQDKQIIQVADEENRVVISKDVDFLETFIVKSEPKKLIMVKTGNIVNKNLLNLIAQNFEMLITMIERSNLVEISREELAEHG
jgi:predicted nuclease of predicted toxin-antitoxin system